MALTVRTVPTDWLCELFVCQICKKQIQKGDKIMRDYQGGADSWLHVTCWDAAWHEHMEQHRLQFEKEQKL